MATINAVSIFEASMCVRLDSFTERRTIKLRRGNIRVTTPSVPSGAVENSTLSPTATGLVLFIPLRRKEPFILHSYCTPSSVRRVHQSPVARITTASIKLAFKGKCRHFLLSFRIFIGIIIGCIHVRHLSSLVLWAATCLKHYNCFYCRLF